MAPQLMPVVVDNASSDDTKSRLAGEAVFIANSENRGFAAAVNQAIRSTSARHLLLLNPDVNLLTPVDGLMEACERSGLAGGKLLDSQGRPQAGFTIRRFPTPWSLSFEMLGLNRLFPGNAVNRRYRYLDRSLDEPGPVDQPAGAFLMIRRDVWDKLGGLDEGFRPIWFEDVDFCKRAVDAGFSIQYVPDVVANHAGAHSIGQLKAGCRAWYWCVSLLRYAAKHFTGIGYRGVCAVMLLSSVPRLLADLMRERSLSPVVVYSKIVTYAGLRLLLGRGVGELPAS
jgi:GT2 family glycosyltransferase